MGPVRADLASGIIALLCTVSLSAATSSAASYLIPRRPVQASSAVCAPALAAYPLSMGPMRGIAAVNGRDVWIAGSTADGVEQPLLLHYDGSRFQTVPISVPTGLLPARFTAIAASSPGDVWAIGASNVTPGVQSIGQPLVVHNEGVRWRLITFPSLGPLGGTLAALSALSAADVWVVGTRLVLQGTSLLDMPLIAHWDGKRWHLLSLSTALPIGDFKAVAALSDRDVWAVGGPMGAPIIAHFDGHTWRVFSSFVGLPLGIEALTGVAAVSSTDIWAVGNYDASNINRGGSGPVTLHWNGRAWHVIRSPNTPGSAANNVQGISLNAIAAFSTSDVWAAGDGIEHWDGARWRIVVEEGRRVVALAGSGHHLWTTETGYSGPNALPNEAVRRWDGANWHTLYSPPPSSPQESVSSLAEPSPHDLWAVGTAMSSTAANAYPEPLLVHGDGTSWARVPAPETSTSPYNYPIPLVSVAGTTASDVWALSGTNAYHWDGARWTLVPGALPARSTGQLSAVTALTAHDAWAVGTAGTGAPGLVMHWDGAHWSRVPSPGGTGSTALHAVAALSPHLVWAVGEIHFTQRRPVSKLWDGGHWRDVPVPNFGPSVEGWLNAVAVVSPRDAWSVGEAIVTNALTGIEETRALLEHWDGTRWSYVPIPGLGAGASSLAAITALSAHDVWAVGSSIEHWDGARWQPIAGPMPAATYTGITASSPTDVWVAGTAPSNGDAAFFAHWNRQCWSVTRVP